MSAATINRCMRYIIDITAGGKAHAFHANLMFRLERTAAYGGWSGSLDGDDETAFVKPTLLFPVRAPEPDGGRWSLVHADMTEHTIAYYDCGRSRSLARNRRLGNNNAEYLNTRFSCLHLILSYLSSRRKNETGVPMNLIDWKLSVPKCQQEVADELSGGFVCRTAAWLIEEGTNNDQSTSTDAANTLWLNGSERRLLQ